MILILHVPQEGIYHIREEPARVELARVKGILSDLFLRRTKTARNIYSCMRWPLRNFYTFNHLVDSYRNTISKWAVGFRYKNFTLKLARGKKSLPPKGRRPAGDKLIFGGEEISTLETRPIRKSYIY
jgi:hypothetical protein